MTTISLDTEICTLAITKPRYESSRLVRLELYEQIVYLHILYYPYEWTQLFQKHPVWKHKYIWIYLFIFRDLFQWLHEKVDNYEE